MNSQVEELYQPLFFFVKNRISNYEDAEDITQEVFLKLSKSDLENVSNVRSWVYTIAKNTITDYYRKRKLLTEEIVENTIDNSTDSSNTLEELSTCVAFYINQLPEEYKVIMELSEIDEISQKDIAKKLDLNYITVRSKVQRGRKKIRALFDQCCSIEQGARGSILGYKKKNIPEGLKMDTEQDDC